ncbi:hypothetical protein D3C75_670460 [compost metagenome]
MALAGNKTVPLLPLGIGGVKLHHPVIKRRQNICIAQGAARMAGFGPVNHLQKIHPDLGSLGFQFCNIHMNPSLYSLEPRSQAWISCSVGSTGSALRPGMYWQASYKEGITLAWMPTA